FDARQTRCGWVLGRVVRVHSSFCGSMHVEEGRRPSLVLPLNSKFSSRVTVSKSNRNSKALPVHRVPRILSTHGLRSQYLNVARCVERMPETLAHRHLSSSLPSRERLELLLALRTHRVLRVVPLRTPLLATQSNDLHALEDSTLNVRLPCVVSELVMIAIIGHIQSLISALIHHRGHVH